jgi:hypothetical protein
MESEKDTVVVEVLTAKLDSSRNEPAIDTVPVAEADVDADVAPLDAASAPPTPADRPPYCASSWATKEITLDDVSGRIQNGSSVYIGSTAASAEVTLKAMTNDWKLADI